MNDQVSVPRAASAARDLRPDGVWQKPQRVVAGSRHEFSRVQQSRELLGGSAYLLPGRGVSDMWRWLCARNRY